MMVGDMYYTLPIHLHQANQHDQVEGKDADAISTTYFGSAAELAEVQTNCLETAVQMKQRALSVFKKKQNMIVIENNNNGQLNAEHQNGGGEQGEGADDATNNNPNSNYYQYIVTIPSAKKTLMNLVLRYISCGATAFRMTHNILQHTTEVF